MYTDFNRYLDDCSRLIEQQIILEITGEVKRGKEATVLCCKAHPDYHREYLAVKIFKTEEYRNFKNKSGYLQGKVWDKRLLKRMAKIKEDLWMVTEFNLLKKLHAAGVNVPEPYDLFDNMLIMEFLGMGSQAAQLLKDLSFTDQEAGALFDSLVTDVDRMLFQGVVHGDLSAYNILYHAGRAVIIDFSQAVHPARHPDAGRLFLRDVENLCAYFTRLGINTDAYALARSIWQQYYPPEF